MKEKYFITDEDWERTHQHKEMFHKNEFGEKVVCARDCNKQELKIDDVCEFVDKDGQLWYCVVQRLDKLVQGCETGLQTFIPGMWASAIHQYWSNRLKIIGTTETHGNLLEGQKKQYRLSEGSPNLTSPLNTTPCLDK
jgi:hypothetical protein